MFDKMVRLSWPSTISDQCPPRERPKIIWAQVRVKDILKELRQETVKEAEERREKQKYANYIPPSERRPLDEYFDLSTIPCECISEPIDLKVGDEEGTFLKYQMEPPKIKRLIESNDIVYYKCTTRFSNG